MIPIIVFFIRRIKKARWLIFLMSYFAGYISLVYSASHFFFGRSNNIIYIVLAAFTLCLFTLILEQFIPYKKFKMINRMVIVVTILFFIANAIWLEGTSVFNSYSSAISSLILFSYCLFYYKLQLEKLQTIFVEKQSSFWIIAGIFIYSSGNFFLFAMFNYLTRHYEGFAFYSWRLNDVLVLIMNLLFAKGIQCNWEK
jgi:hypothetical protein